MNHDNISKDLTIGDVVREYPAVIEILQDNGIHCVGCHVAYHETLEQGFKGHGLSDEEVDKLIADMNKAVEDQPELKSKDLIITKKASSKLYEILKEHDKLGSALRVTIVPGGCSGSQYEMALDDVHDSDKVFAEGEVKFIMSQDDFSQLKGSKIDFVESLQGGGFKITNPNVASTCGCGQSFS